jgi:PhnB protein
MEVPMATAAIPYITFAGNAREGLNFYQSVFGGKVEISTFGDFNVPGAPTDGVMHGALTTDEFAIYGSDSMATGVLGDPARIRIAIAGDDLETASATFDGLAQGGKVVTPLEKQTWGDMYGEVVDQYGISWMFNIGTPA